MINRVVLVGRITRDIELRKTQDGTSVASFSIAVDGRARDAEGKRSTTFVNCVAWRQNADILNNYTHKGSLIGIEGYLQSRQYTKQDGSKNTVIEVVCDRVALLETKAQSEGRSDFAPTTPIDIPDVSEEKTDISGYDPDNDLPF